MNDNRPRKPRALQRFDRLTGDMNVLLAVFALCLAVLDTTVFVTLRLSDEILGRAGTGATLTVEASPAAGLRTVTDSW